MKHYNKNSKLDFGLYKGYELAMVYIFDTDYIEWCINKIDWFHITDIDELMKLGLIGNIVNWEHRMCGSEAVNGLPINIWKSYNEMVEDIGPDYSPNKYTFSNETIEKNHSKTSSIESFRSIQDNDNYNNDISTYNGYNGWSDDAIDEAFDGDPESTWNVD